MLTLTNSYYTEALKILKDRFENNQQIVYSYMERYANLPNISSDSNLTEIRKFYAEIESHVRCLDSLNIKSDSYSALLAPVIVGKLPPQLKLVVSRNVRLELWGLAKLLNLIITEIKTRANCGEYNFCQGSEFDHLGLWTTSALASQASKSISNKCVFGLGQHWSDKCNVITNTKTRKIYLKNHKICFNCLREGHLSNKRLKTKGFYYCKGIHNSAICNKREERKIIETTSNLSSSNKEMTLPQTAEVYVVNERKNKEIKLKVLFDSGSEKSFLSQRAYACLHLPTICTENLKINTFGNKNSQNALAKEVRFPLKTAENKSIETKAYVTPLICLPIKTQPLNLAKSILKSIT